MSVTRADLSVRTCSEVSSRHQSRWMLVCFVVKGAVAGTDLLAERSCQGLLFSAR